MINLNDTNMNATEIKLQKNGFTLNATTYPARSHYKFIMSIGRAFPSTSVQAKFFVKNQIVLDVLTADDVEVVEFLLNKHGFIGQYKHTKSKSWVRLINHNDLYAALKKEYNL